jgi:hypothetical protein
MSGLASIGHDVIDWKLPTVLVGCGLILGCLLVLHSKNYPVFAYRFVVIADSNLSGKRFGRLVFPNGLRYGNLCAASFVPGHLRHERLRIGPADLRRSTWFNWQQIDDLAPSQAVRLPSYPAAQRLLLRHNGGRPAVHRACLFQNIAS